MPGQAAAASSPDLARGEVELVMEDDDVAGLELVEAHGFAHGAARCIHESLRASTAAPAPGQACLGNEPLEALAPVGEAVRGRDGIDRHEADIVTVESVSLFRIAEADKELHQSHPGSTREGEGLPSDPSGRKQALALLLLLLALLRLLLVFFLVLGFALRGGGSLDTLGAGLGLGGALPRQARALQPRGPRLSPP